MLEWKVRALAYLDSRSSTRILADDKDSKLFGTYRAKASQHRRHSDLGTYRQSASFQTLLPALNWRRSYARALLSSTLTILTHES